MRPSIPLKTRIAKHTARAANGCLEWTRSLNSGYGYVRDGKKMVMAHRANWEICNGAIPDGLFVLHRCDNPKCVDPTHLFLGTAADNSRDMVSKNRHKPSRLAGEKHGKSTLTLADVRAIRAAPSILTLKEIATIFSISLQQVSRIRCGKSWITSL